MPANVSWKELYQTELFQLTKEGYVLEGMTPAPGDEKLPIPDGLIGYAKGGIDEEKFFREAYRQLREKRDKSDFRSVYEEPNDYDAIIAAAPAEPMLEMLDDAAYADRVRGAWFGRCAAVILGKPLEMGFDRLKVKEYLESVDAYPLSDYVPARSEKLGIELRRDCVPSTLGNVRYVQSDDDIHHTICSLLLAERHGEGFSLMDAANNLLDNLCYHWLWTSDRMLFYNIVNLDMAEDVEEQLRHIADKLNPWRESMCPQLKSDFWGYITPGEPRRGAKMIHRLGSLSATKNGLYGGMFVQGCTSAALTERPSAGLIIEGGLSNIPYNSRLAEAVRNVVGWHGEGNGWEWTCDKIYQRYGDWYFAGAINNIAFIVLALLEGDLDFERTITTAVMCGTDTDCNSANAGSIVAAALGYEKLPKKWIEPLNDRIKSCVAGYGEGTISELAQRTLRVRAKMIKTIG